MPILLIRHAQAVDPRHSSGADRERPLTPAGEETALALAAQWQRQPITRVLSSPYPRCMATVSPLAQHLGLPVEPTAQLGEGHATAALQMLRRLDDQMVVACSHGDVIPAVLSALAAGGIVVDDPWRCENASTWVLHTDGGWITSTEYLAPPQPSH